MGTNAVARGGWTAKETDALFCEARLAGESGRPMKSVFDRVAALTGRKPNSIRNYYYLKIKEDGSLGTTTFVPFEEEETEALMRRMLAGQAEGRSVRALAIELGGGDKKLMLRYQNKYRSMIKNSPDYVRSLVERLRTEGTPCRDPYDAPRKQEIEEVVRELSAYALETGKDGETAIRWLHRVLCCK